MVVLTHLQTKSSDTQKYLIIFTINDMLTDFSLELYLYSHIYMQTQKKNEDVLRNSFRTAKHLIHTSFRITFSAQYFALSQDMTPESSQDIF